MPARQGRTPAAGRSAVPACQRVKADHLPPAGVTLRNLSDDWMGFALSGPNSRAILARLTDADLSNAAFPFLACREMQVGMADAVVARIALTGELGYEIYCEPQFHLALFEHIERQGADLGLRLYGARALMSLRLEKQWGVWTLDYRPDFTAAQSGLDAFIDWNHSFIGREAALEERDAGPTRRLVTLTVDVDQQDVVGDEAILCDSECVGHVTSGGYAHHVSQSVAFGYVSSGYAVAGRRLQVEIDGVMRAAVVQGAPLYDPDGVRMRA